MSEEMIKELLEKLKQCDDFHNRCDFLMEHSEITYMLDYITNLQQENKQLKEKYEKAIKEINRINNIDVNDYYETLVCKELAIDNLIEELESGD